MNDSEEKHFAAENHFDFQTCFISANSILLLLFSFLGILFLDIET